MAEHTSFSFSIPALRVLENEHQLLRHLMSKWHPLVLAFERQTFVSEAESRHVFQLLRQQITEFKQPLTKHFDKEELYVFPALAKYVGDEQGPVLATEEEHEEIFAYIDHFLHHANVDEHALNTEQMTHITTDAQEAFEVITFHMIKEESVIFPMVESILQPKEHYDLLEKLYSKII